MTTPWLSVVMPTFNGEAWIRFALDSICQQDHREVEVLVIDDGSTDSTLDLVRSYEERLSLEIVRRTHSGNWTTSANEGLARARGRYVCWLHQDDVWEAGRLEAIHGILQAYPKADIVLHPSHFIDSTGHRTGRWSCPLPNRSGGFLSQNMVWKRLLVQNFVASCAPVVRTDAARHVGGLDERLWYTADWDFWLKLTTNGRTLFHPAPLLSVRIHPASQTMNRAPENEVLRQQYQLVLDRHLLPWEAADKSRRSIGARARHSAEVNLALASWAGSGRIPWRELAKRIVALSPWGQFWYIRHSRLIERVNSRLRAGRLLRAADSVR